ncbi:ABC transporter ATP-binding protein [Camelliibacillus cellulosilyticus]|uniref:ABC transporter ATP-binding protein n=1 Tax=Camelliibacillus cellulosilyticus TaxID=2174486 RepID=A0ABV9GJV4_9BACL
MSYVIEMRHIRKEFPGIVANDDITLQVERGEIHALLGENGAGKSTLMNVLFGLYQPEWGDIYVKGEKVKITGPTIAGKLGIGMVHQHFMLIDKFTVTENIILGDEPTKAGRINQTKARKQVLELSKQYGLNVDPDKKIRDISVGMQQRVEILKTLYRGADILIFDEPTAVLTPQEIRELMKIMKRLVKEGKSIILITHKLKEIMAVADRCTVIRRGKGIGTVNVSETNPNKLASMMVGRDIEFTVNDSPSEPAGPVLEIQDLSIVDDRKITVVDQLNLTVNGGEILGIAGVDGNGQSELVEAIAGLRKVSSGSIRLKGTEISNRHPRKIYEEGVGHIPEDRHKHGLILDFSIGDNLVLQTYYQKPYATAGILHFNQIRQQAQRLIGDFDVRTPSIDTPTRALSGGNQQKAIIAREIDRDPDLLIASQPTRGLDVGAIEFIHKRLLEQRKRGKAVLLISLELEEIMNISDRIAVIYNGKIIDFVKPKETNEDELGLLMAGHKGEGGKQDENASEQ